MATAEARAARASSSVWHVGLAVAAVARAVTFPRGETVRDLVTIATIHRTGSLPTDAEVARIVRRLSVARAAVVLGAAARLTGALGRPLPRGVRMATAALGVLETAGSLVLERESQQQLAGFGGYYQHLWFGSALGVAAASGRVLADDATAADRRALAVARAYYGGLYSTSGLSKIRRTGRDVLGPAVLRHAELTYGREGVSPMPAEVLRPLGVASLIIECAAGPLALRGGRASAASGASLALLHLGIFARLRISFWHLAAPAVVALSGEQVAAAVLRVVASRCRPST